MAARVDDASPLADALYVDVELFEQYVYLVVEGETYPLPLPKGGE